jgi:hypothetical protein
LNVVKRSKCCLFFITGHGYQEKFKYTGWFRSSSHLCRFLSLEKYNNIGFISLTGSVSFSLLNYNPLDNIPWQSCSMSGIVGF